MEIMKSHPDLSKRASGVLLHPTSLPGPYGIGDIGPSAHKFAEFLSSASQAWWQMLPVGPAGFADSPYAALSAFAGNHLMISPELLVKEGWVSDSDCAPYGGNPECVDYGNVISSKTGIIKRAMTGFYEKTGKKGRDDFAGFCSINWTWLDDYALFMSLKEESGGKPWTAWSQELRRRDKGALEEARKRLANEIRFWKFTQFCFGGQWEQLRARCRELGIAILGDMPIFVNHDSSDVWARPDIFRLDGEGNPESVAGVPPDYFSKDGQWWGNPLYRWDVMRTDGYSWWADRFKRTFSLFDAVRIDHFIGFSRYWAIPASCGSAKDGHYEEGPGAHFFEAVREQLGSLPLLAEDLGIVTPEVTALREKFGFPGMRVLQFAFGGDESNPYLPKNCSENSFIYTGTHDNDTTVGWFKGTEGKGSTRSQEQVARERNAFLALVGGGTGEPHWDLMKLAMETVCRVSVFPAQDLLGLGSNARMNVPGINDGNWQWRLREGALGSEITSRLKKLALLSRRAPEQS